MQRRFSPMDVLYAGILAWMLHKTAGRVSPALPIALTVVGIGNVGILWGVRHRLAFVNSISGVGWLRWYITLVSRCAGYQQPQDSTATKSSGWLLHGKRDCAVAARKAKSVVRGQDRTVDIIFDRVSEAMTLRRRRRHKKGLSPIASILLVGGEGVGKVFLARVVAKLLFRSADVSVFPCDRLEVGTLVGTNGKAGSLTQSVSRTPDQLIVFEQIDCASPAVRDVLSSIVTQGVCRDNNTGEEVSFANSVVVMTSTTGVDQLESLIAKTTSESVRQRETMSAIASESSLDKVFLNALSAILFCPRPTDTVKAEVVTMLMQKEAKAHGASLAHVDPEIVASQVWLTDESDGFGTLPHHVNRLMRKPLVAAAERGRDKIALRVEIPSSSKKGS